MDTAKRSKLESAGFKVGSVADFIGLTSEEIALIEVRLALSTAVRKRRLACSLTQVALAESLHSSQRRIAKMEAGDPRVSIDLLVRTLLATGATRQEV